MRLGKLLSGWSSGKQKLSKGTAQLCGNHASMIIAAPTMPLSAEQPSTPAPVLPKQQNVSLPPVPPSAGELGNCRASRQNGSTSSGGSSSGGGDWQVLGQQLSSAQHEGNALQAVHPSFFKFTAVEVQQLVGYREQRQPADHKGQLHQAPEDGDAQDCPGASVLAMTDSYIWAAIADMLQLYDGCAEYEQQAGGGRDL